MMPLWIFKGKKNFEKCIFQKYKHLTALDSLSNMLNSPKGSRQKNIEYQKNPEFWENFSVTSLKILEVIKSTSQNPENFSLDDPSKIKFGDASFVSLFLYQILENPQLKNQELTEFSGKRKYFFSEHILHYIVTVHSNNNMLKMNSIEKILGIIYSNPEIPISNTVKKAHLRINFADNPIDVWNRLFPSSSYRNSILLTVQGPGVMYSGSEIKEGTDLNFYDSNKL
jgi:hypothetical protein